MAECNVQPPTADRFPAGRWPPPSWRHHPRAVRLAPMVMLAVAMCAGCGYALAGRGSFLPADIRTVDIPRVENRTAVIGLEPIFTQKLQAEFIGRGKYDVVAAGAHAVLRSEIVSFDRQAAGLTNQQLASRYLVTVVVKASFTDARTNEVLWSNDALIFREEYDLGGLIDGASFVDQQRSSVERIAADVARTVVTAITEAF